MTADFSYKYFITVTGQADITIKKLSLDIEADLSTQPGDATDELAPKVAIPKVNIGVNPDDIDINLTGGLVAKIANVFIPMIKNSIIPGVISQL